MHIYTQEEIKFIRKNAQKYTLKEAAEIFSKHFGWQINVNQLKGCMARNGIKTGRTGRFEKGHVSHNKGKKGLKIPGSEKGWFRKGHIPHTHKPVGSERMSVDGYVEVKIKEPNVWRLKHKVEWEKVNGPVPKGSVLLFRTNDKRNTSVENLILTTRAVHAVLNNQKLSKYEDEGKEVAINIAKLKIATAERKKKTDNEKRAKRKSNTHPGTLRDDHRCTSGLLEEEVQQG